MPSSTRTGNVKEIQCAPENQHNTQERKQQNGIYRLKRDKYLHHRMTRHRMNRHRMSAESSKSLAYSALPDRIFWERKTDSHKFSRELFCSTPKPLVRRETRPPFEDRSVNQQSYEPHPHSKRRHRRGKRSLLQKLIHTCNRHQKRSENRREFRRVRSCWKALARLPAKLSWLKNES